MKSIRKAAILALTLLVPMIFIAISSVQAKTLKVLIVTGQNNHNWPISHKALQLILEQSDIFEVNLAVTPPKGGDMQLFKPQFERYDVVLLDYNGDRWPKATDEAFLRYVKRGGGVVVYHAADNAFADWEEFNKIIALGGWEGRNEKSGPYYYLVDGQPTLDNSPGTGGSHGSQRTYPMNCRNAQHPITKGLPDGWIHAQDEMYDRMRGPANIKDLLYSGYADPTKGGSGREEPLIFTVDYGKARIFHIMIGHCGPSLDNNPAMQCVGFQTLLLRGTEWAATGKVKQSLPSDFPTGNTPSFRNSYKAEK